MTADRINRGDEQVNSAHVQSYVAGSGNCPPPKPPTTVNQQAGAAAAAVVEICAKYGILRYAT